MSRIKIDLPSSFPFSTTIAVRITDLNYGGHAGNDAFLALIHEARMQFLKSYGYAELSFAGIGLIMRDAGIEFKDELFYGDAAIISVAATNFTKVSFDLFYKMEKEVNGQTKLVAVAKTGMVGYDYNSKKVAAIPQEAIDRIQSA